MQIKIGRGLGEAWALAGEHWRVLLAYALMGVVFPYLFLSSEPIFSLRNIMAVLSDPWTNRVGGSITGPLYLIGIVLVIVFGVMLAAWSALLAEIRDGYVSEIMYGMVAGFAYILAYVLLYMMVALVLVLPLMMMVGVEDWARAGPVVAGLRQLAFTLIGAWLLARFCLVGPIMAAGGRLEPFSPYVESWRRTASAQWWLFGFFLLYNIGFGALFGGLVVLHGAVILVNEPGSLAETMMSALWVVLFGLYFFAQLLIPAGLYRASEPGASAAEVFA
jgi:type IV secretory pathway VirB2 component (pilin)